MLDCPHCARPGVFNGGAVPDVLLAGNHAEVDKWRRAKQLELTRRLRPDLLKGEDK